MRWRADAATVGGSTFMMLGLIMIRTREATSPSRESAHGARGIETFPEVKAR